MLKDDKSDSLHFLTVKLHLYQTEAFVTKEQENFKII